jgi:hypothetical protein
MMKKIYLSLVLAICTASFVFAQKIPTPKEHFGFEIGDDYKLAHIMPQMPILERWQNYPIG